MSGYWDDDPKPWHCGICGGDTEGCTCGDPLALIVRVPGLTSADTEHLLAGMNLVAMINEQRVENYEGDEGYGPAPVRLLASGWGIPEEVEGP
jgi:hypothetical protein